MIHIVIILQFLHIKIIYCVYLVKPVHTRTFSDKKLISFDTGLLFTHDLTYFILNFETDSLLFYLRIVDNQKSLDKFHNILSVTYILYFIGTS